jgi:hypothetical protein
MRLSREQFAVFPQLRDHANSELVTRFETRIASCAFDCVYFIGRDVLPRPRVLTSA